MRCTQPAPSSSAAVPQPALDSSATTPSSARGASSAHPSHGPPSLLPCPPPPAASSSQRLASYFHGLAAGDDLTELIRGLRSSMWLCYQGCMLDERVSSASTVSDGMSNNADAVQPSTMQPIPAPTVPHPLPMGAMPASERRHLWSATKAALLFAAESPAAAEEATLLHCSPVARSLLFPYYYPLHRHNADGHDSHLSLSSSLALPLSGALRHVDMQFVLSDTQVVELAKGEMQNSSSEGWQQRAVALLHQVAPTPLTTAVELEVYRHTDGQHWAEAVACLWRLAPAQWTEMDVAAVVRCLYNAARRENNRGAFARHPPAGRGSLNSAEVRTAKQGVSDAAEEGLGCRGAASPGEQVLLLHRLIAEVLKIHQAVEEAGVLRWSTPSALNDTLGLFAQDAAGASWREACALLDKLLAEPVPATENREPNASAPRRVGVGNEPESAGKGPRSPSLPAATVPASSSLYQLVRPNAVTVHQTCRAFHTQWAVGLHCVRRLQERFGNSLELLSDMAATEDVLRLCIEGQRWQEALRVVTAHQTFLANKHKLAGTNVRYTTSKQQHRAAELPRDRQHYRPDVFVQLVRLLGSNAAGHRAASDLVKHHESLVKSMHSNTSSSSSRAWPLTSAAHTQERSGLSMSKHYNSGTLLRAYNCLVQGSGSLAAADVVIRRLQERQQQYSVVGEAAESVVPSSSKSEAAFDALLGGLETESVAHVAYLSSVAGNWQRALHHTNALLHHPRYQVTFLPTARLHDAVQYALEQAPLPGPSWQVSMKLFTDMMDRHVPSSEVSFQSAVRRCFVGEVPEQAQKLFHVALKRGVRP